MLILLTEKKYSKPGSMAIRAQLVMTDTMEVMLKAAYQAPISRTALGVGFLVSLEEEILIEEILGDDCSCKPADLVGVDVELQCIVDQGKEGSQGVNRREQEDMTKLKPKT